MKSANTFPHRLTEIDQLTRQDHWYLNDDDACCFFGEYSAGEGYRHSTTNQLIINFKKPTDRRGLPEWKYKEKAIRETATAFKSALLKVLDRLTFVPIPPSKAKDDPLYDDRMVRMLNSIRPTPPLDIRELIVQIASTESVHVKEERMRPEQIENLYRVDDKQCIMPVQERIVIVDDVLTTGAHFRAAKSILTKRFPQTRIVGLFIARTARDMVDFEPVSHEN